MEHEQKPKIAPSSSDKLEFLYHRYQDNVENLRFLGNYDFKVSSFYIGLQLGICAWLLAESGGEIKIFPKLVFLLFDFAWLISSILILQGTGQRRDEIIETIRRIGDVFGLNEEGTFLPRKRINPTLDEIGVGIFCWKIDAKHDLFTRSLGKAIALGRNHRCMQPAMMVISFICVIISLII